MRRLGRAGLSVPPPTLQAMVEVGAVEVGEIGEPGAAAPLPPPPATLSPSRAADFKTCPLLFRYRTVDRLPEAPSHAAARGTLVHAVLERLFDLPAAERTPAAAQALVDPVWDELRGRERGWDALFEAPATETPIADQVALELGLPEVPTSGPARERAWLDSARALLVTYFRLEDPTRLEPAAREERVEVEAAGLRLRGIVDRIDVNADGDVRIVDYKTGASPRAASEARAMFQLKFYALVVRRTRGVTPKALRLLYLADGDVLTYVPDPDELDRFERTLAALGVAIGHAVAEHDFPPHRGRHCRWCSFQAVCPAWGGTALPYPAGVAPTPAEFDDAGASAPVPASTGGSAMARQAGNTNGASVVSR